VRLPAMNTLRALEGVARRGSMTRAAQELNVTPSAVSHALRQLEHELGFQLTVREGKGIELTQAGRLYAEEVRKALAILAQAGAAAGEAPLQGRFCLSCPPGFAMFWLIEHIGEFRDFFPQVRLKIVTPERLDAVVDSDVDLFIAYGNGNWRGYASELLTELDFTPYCSPALLNAMGGVRTPADLGRFPLLHLRTYEDWTRWFSAAGVSNLSAESGIVFSSMDLVQSGAVNGLGVAMGDHIACRAAMAEGLLVRPFELSIKSTEAYYFVTVPNKRDLPISIAFREWVRDRISDRSSRSGRD